MAERKIYIIIGTKAQYIKMMPLMKEFDNLGLRYTLIDTGQHINITKKIISAYKLQQPELYLKHTGTNVNKLVTALIWNTKILTVGLLKCKRLIKKNDLCLVHGDTLSTLQGSLIAKVCRAKLIHIEAGERTFNWREPFPEEIIRRVVDRISHVCFASSEISHKNLLKENVRAEIVNVDLNTIVDSVRLAETIEPAIVMKEQYALVSIHRAETLYSQPRMQIVVDTVLKIASSTKVVWGLHDVTKKSLQKYGLLNEILNKSNIELHELFDYATFIDLIRQAEYLVTDGGGPQEESYLLNVPCLLMRAETEREFYRNICLAKFDPQKIDAFLKNYQNYQSSISDSVESPSKKICSYINDEFMQSDAVIA